MSQYRGLHGWPVEAADEAPPGALFLADAYRQGNLRAFWPLGQLPAVGDYLSTANCGTDTAATWTNTTSGRALFGGLIIPEPVAIGSIACNVAASAASSNVRVGIATYESVDRPKDLTILYCSPTISSTTTGIKTDTTCGHLELEPGFYFPFVAAQGGNPTLSALTGWNTLLAPGIQSQTPGTDPLSSTSNVGRIHMRWDSFPTSGDPQVHIPGFSVIVDWLANGYPLISMKRVA